MHGVIVHEWAEGPKYSDSLPAQTPRLKDSNQPLVKIKVLYVGVPRLVLARAAGKHYSAKTLPHIPGVEGIGKIASTDELVYFATLPSGIGSLVSEIEVPEEHVFKLAPLAEGRTVYPEVIAGLVNPALGGFMALTNRTGNALDTLKDWTLGILGGTTASGRLIAQMAPTLGAKKVIGAARREDELKESYGAANYVVLNGDKTDWTLFEEADIILDFVYGEVMENFINNFHPKKPLQIIHIGGLSSQNANLHGPFFREYDVTFRGSGFGSFNMQQLLASMPLLLKTLMGLGEKEREGVIVKSVKDVEETWGKDDGKRLVYEFEE